MLFKAIVGTALHVECVLHRGGLRVFFGIPYLTPFTCRILTKSLHFCINIANKIYFFVFKFLKGGCNILTSFIGALISGTHCVTAQLFNPHFLWIDNVNLSRTLPFQIFSANNNRWSKVKHQIDPPITAVALRFHPTAWSGDMCMRVEAYGCDGECKTRERDGMGSRKARAGGVKCKNHFAKLKKREEAGARKEGARVWSRGRHGNGIR